ncbi:hypothetical protein LTR35_017324, partial [Friedmanniomyces endolithicus]
RVGKGGLVRREGGYRLICRRHEVQRARLRMLLPVSCRTHPCRHRLRRARYRPPRRRKAKTKLKSELKTKTLTQTTTTTTRTTTSPRPAVSLVMLAGTTSTTIGSRVIIMTMMMRITGVWLGGMTGARMAAMRRRGRGRTREGNT